MRLYTEELKIEDLQPTWQIQLSQKTLDEILYSEKVQSKMNLIWDEEVESAALVKALSDSIILSDINLRNVVGTFTRILPQEFQEEVRNLFLRLVRNKKQGGEIIKKDFDRLMDIGRSL